MISQKTDRILVNPAKIERLDLDNKKHGMILINYSKGVK